MGSVERVPIKNNFDLMFQFWSYIEVAINR